VLRPLNPPITRWRDARVWLVGASSGIGEALAHELLARGARVALSARREAPLQAIARNTDPQHCLVLPMDVLDERAAADALRAIHEQWNGIDLVMWVAGIYEPLRAFELNLEAARRTLRVNVEGVFNGLACVVPAMLAQGAGTISIVSSVAGYGGLPKALAYGPSKAALNNLAEALYLDLHPRGIGVHLVCPGFVETPATAVNDFEMPALLSAPQAARRILAGLERGDFETHFPRRFTLVLRLLRLLPRRVYFALLRRMAGSP
jgi:NAD(P)-dependent dehydrogenase (short-subunit alcohol dehydrogenase family)